MAKHLVLCSALFSLTSLPALATELGTPMDCSDLILAPGLTCTEFSQPGEGRVFRQNDAVVDNEGKIYTESAGDISDILEELGTCGSRDLFEMGQVWHIGPGGVRTPIISSRNRCLDETTSSVERVGTSTLLFDAVRGALVVGMVSSCSTGSFGACDNYGGGSWIAHIDGFTPLTDVLPTPATLCSNGIDDDNDGTIDLEDKDCKNSADNDESRP